MWPFTNKEPVPPHKENVGKSRLAYHMKDGSKINGPTFRGHWHYLMGDVYVISSYSMAENCVESKSRFRRETDTTSYVNIDLIARVEIITEDCWSEVSGRY